MASEFAATGAIAASVDGSADAGPAPAVVATRQAATIAGMRCHFFGVFGAK
ncbi:hypothetical protein [Mycolicibacterium sp. PDY-3]|uniref:hypothetical protein n=1 Tax=Mycolicibacterium sp. PDY-3 TaxID=3376069 RepID=UPI003795595A